MQKELRKRLKKHARQTRKARKEKLQERLRQNLKVELKTNKGRARGETCRKEHAKITWNRVLTMYILQILADSVGRFVDVRNTRMSKSTSKNCSSSWYDHVKQEFWESDHDLHGKTISSRLSPGRWTSLPVTRRVLTPFRPQIVSDITSCRLSAQTNLEPNQISLSHFRSEHLVRYDLTALFEKSKKKGIRPKSAKDVVHDFKEARVVTKKQVEFENSDGQVKRNED